MAAPALIGNTVFFNQAYLGELREWSTGATASAFSVYAVVTVVFNMIGGALVDRLTALAMVLFFLVPLGAGLLVLGAIRSVVVAILVFASAAGPGVSGFLIDRGVSYAGQIVAMGVYCLIASVLMVKVTGHLRARRYRHPSAEEASRKTS